MALGTAAKFDGFSRMTRVDVGTNNKSTLSYDNNGDLTSSTHSGATAPVPDLTASYNRADQTTSINGTTLTHLCKPERAHRRRCRRPPEQHPRTEPPQPVRPERLLHPHRDRAAIGQRTPSGRKYYVTDRLGSIVALTSNTGAILTSPTYEPWGSTTNTGGLGSGTSTSYLGWLGSYSTTTGLVHFGARYYSPQQRRWTQPDPLDQAGDRFQGNRYAYAANDPVNRVDPSGMWVPLAAAAARAVAPRAAALTISLASKYGRSPVFATESSPTRSLTPPRTSLRRLARQSPRRPIRWQTQAKSSSSCAV